MYSMTFARPTFLFAAVTALMSLAATAPVAQAQRAPLVELGSPKFQPTPQQPIGWRGDGTGRFPAATPPLEWYRRPVGAFNDIWVLADQPKGNAPVRPAKAPATASGTKAAATKAAATKAGKNAADSNEGEPLNMGTVREWLVAGPFDAKDHTSALEDAAEPNEAVMQPAAGQKLHGKPWTVMHVSVANQSQSWSRLTLDLALAYDMDEHQERQNHPGTLEPKVAYACTHLYSIAAGRVRMRIEATKAVAWINGEPVKVPTGPYEQTPIVELRRGWNLLMVKMASSSKNWNMSTLIFPIADAGYETKNIRWQPCRGRASVRRSLSDRRCS